TSVADSAALLESAVTQLTGAQRASCLYHDASDGSLWSESRPPGGDEEAEHSAERGIARFAARTRQPLLVPRAGGDPRFDPVVDDPDGPHRHDGAGDSSVMASPVVGPDGVVHAVLVAARTVPAEGRRWPGLSDRRSSVTPFAAEHFAALNTLSEQLGPPMHQLALRVDADAVIESLRGGSMAADDLFRPEALQAYLSRGKQGDVVRVSPAWVRWAYWPLLAVLVAAAVFLIVGRVNQYSVGPALIQVSGKSDVTASVTGTVVTVEVAPGQAVRAGEVLARLHDVGEQADFVRLQGEFHSQLRSRMLDPGDPVTGQAVRTLRAEVERAHNLLEQRTIRAPASGTVSDVRIRPGQYIRAGELVVALRNDDTQLSLIALLPGQDRPQLAPGMSMRLELSGYRYAYQELVIAAVGEEVIGPAEVRRSLSGRIADGVPITGPVVVVEAVLP
ncbi:MAG: HlyD family efflux transporter periplasmic adaptor subunit, partial [Myxococcota bacterium]